MDTSLVSGLARGLWEAELEKVDLGQLPRGQCLPSMQKTLRSISRAGKIKKKSDNVIRVEPYN